MNDFLPRGRDQWLAVGSAVLLYVAVFLLTLGFLF